MKRILIALLALCGVGLMFYKPVARAQSPVITQPYGTTSQNSSSTITATNTFQTIWTQVTTRRGRAGCMIQNLGTNPMFVFFGTAASALTAQSVKITTGQSTTCNI